MGNLKLAKRFRFLGRPVERRGGNEMITGRPSKYTEERAEQICSRIVEGESLRSICSAADMPDKATVFRWLARHPDFCDQYRAAKWCLMEIMVEEIMAIADDSSRDTLFTRDG